jgi:uncharacterized protein (TIGR02145 family)
MKKTVMYVALVAVVGAVVLMGVGGCNVDNSESHDNVERYLGQYDAEGTLSYGGQTYRTVTIGKQTWMAENMNYKLSHGNTWCYDNDPSNCAKYGRLYDWTAAMAVCPGGWRLPDTADWNTLAQAVGGTKFYYNTNGDWTCDSVGKKLKSKSGWNELKNNGTDNFEFTALPGGMHFTNEDGDFHHLGIATAFFTATERNDTAAYIRIMGWGHDNLQGWDDPKYFGQSVRCLKN